jgi:beta-lactamase regulating signal transducer with metallopeptidase domain/Tol biopolymer transport system component
MWALNSLDRLIVWTDVLTPILANLMFYSTIIGSIGLLGAHMLKKRGAVYQSLFLRLSLLAILITPFAALVLSSFDAGINLPIAQVKRPDTVGVIGNPKVSISEQKNLMPAQPVPHEPVRTSIPLQDKDLKDQMAPLTDNTAVSNPDNSLNTKKESTLPPSGGNNIPVKKGKENNRYLNAMLPFLYVTVTLLWALLSLVLLMRAGIHNLYIKYLLHTAYTANPAHIKTSRALAEELKVKPPRVLQSPLVKRSFLAGFFSPAIVLPLHENEASMSSREVFLHEFAHMIRHDHLWNLLCQVGKIILPLQPLIWLLAREIEVTSEYVCDDYVVVYGKSNKKYAFQLYNMAKMLQAGRREISAGVGIFSVRSYLLKRIERILDQSHSRFLTLKFHEMLSFIVLFLSFVVLTGFVSFRGEVLKRKDASGVAYSRENQISALVKTEAGNILHSTVESLNIPDDSDTKETVSLQKEKKALSEEEKLSGLSLEAEAVPSAGEKVSPESTAMVTLANADLGQEFKHETSPMISQTVSQLKNDSETGISHSEKISDRNGSEAIQINEKNSRKFFSSADSLKKSAHTEFIALSNKRITPQTTFITPGKFTLNINTKENASNSQLSQEMVVNLQRGQANLVWSPDGRRVAFTDYYGYSVWTVAPGSGDLRCVFDSKTTIINGLLKTIGFTPDGREILFVNYIPSSTGRIVPAIQAVDAMTGTIRTVMEETSDGCYSQDGRYFAYVNWIYDYFQCATRLFNYNYEFLCSTLFVYDTQTGKTREIAENGISPSFSPDGSSVFYSGMDSRGQLQLFRIPATGGIPAQLTIDGNWRTAKVSPSGEWIFCSGRSMDGTSPKAQLRFYNMKSGKTYDIFPGLSFHLEAGAWSPDGNQYAYTVLEPLVIKDGFMSGGPFIYIDNFNLNTVKREITSGSERPVVFSLSINFPNPFNASTTIPFSISKPGKIELEIFNSIGQKVRTLISENRSPGTYTAVWDARNDYKMPVSSGAYIVRLKGEGKVETRSITLLK